MKVNRYYFTVLLAVAAWCSLIILPPVMAHYYSIDSGATKSLYRLFSPVCHQYDSHSFHIFGYKLAVCARCSAIYFGFFFGTVLAGLTRISVSEHRRYIILAAVPMAIDVLMNATGLSSSSPWTRGLTGSIFGISAALILIPILLDGISEIISKSSTIQGVQHESET